MSPREIVALAADYDRTLTDVDLGPVPAALDALALARRRGKRIVVVSGRGLDFLAREVGDAADALVAENGALVRGPDGVVRSAGGSWDVRARLDALGIPVEHGDRIASFDREHEPVVRKVLEEARLDVVLVPNRDRMMALPRGVDKAAGLRRALALLGIDPARAAAVGDAENDIAMLLSVGHGLAVANAVEDLKAIAHETLPEQGGHGVAAWITRRWLAPEVSARNPRSP